MHDYNTWPYPVSYKYKYKLNLMIYQVCMGIKFSFGQGRVISLTVADTSSETKYDWDPPWILNF